MSEGGRVEHMFLGQLLMEERDEGGRIERTILVIRKTREGLMRDVEWEWSGMEGGRDGGEE